MEKQIGDEVGDSRVKTHSLHNQFFIKGFFGPYRFLSNFHISPVDYEGLRYNSVEAAYQSAKETRLADREAFTKMAPREAKRAGQKVLIRADWESIKVRVMTECIFSKFLLDSGLRARLTDTRDKYLEETNWWGDDCWGNDPSTKVSGKNNLGKVSMGVRELFKTVEI